MGHVSPMMVICELIFKNLSITHNEGNLFSNKTSCIVWPWHCLALTNDVETQQHAVNVCTLKTRVETWLKKENVIPVFVGARIVGDGTRCTHWLHDSSGRGWPAKVSRNEEESRPCSTNCSNLMSIDVGLDPDPRGLPPQYHRASSSPCRPRRRWRGRIASPPGPNLAFEVS